jgi:hypothetical protein
MKTATARMKNPQHTVTYAEGVCCMHTLPGFHAALVVIGKQPFILA